MLKEIIRVMFLAYKGTARYEHLIKIQTLGMKNSRILFQGKANEVPEKLLDECWTVVSINPDYNLLNNPMLKDVPDYNLPTIITVA